jgi:predicted alpha-1,2-mannosidase
MGDYGAFSLMPVVGELVVDGERRASPFNHVNEVATPYYYQVMLDRYNVKAEMVPSTRGGIMKFTYPESNFSYIIFDGLPGGSFLRLIPQQRRIIGYVQNHSGAVPKNFALYFVVEFDKEFLSYTTFNNDSLKAMSRETSGDHAGIAIRFATERNEAVHARIATSFISVKQAILNFNAEIEKFSFDQLKIRALQQWNLEMNRIEVEGGTADQKTNFYTGLYRMLLFPRIFYEYDETGKMVHYSPYDDRVHDGYMYTDNGFWDTFRAVFPFLTIMYPEQNAQIMQGLVNAYKEGGWLPTWPSPGYRKVMIGTHAASLFADAYMKGIRDFDVDLAYQAMKKDAFVIPPKYAPGRDGLKYYNDLGYVPYPEVKEATAKTLEYAYDDFCIWQMAKSMGKTDDVDLFRAKAMNYQNVFDPATNFMRGKNAQGEWLTPFDPIEWGGPYTEGNAWHYSWSVFHDIDGLIGLMGGRDAFVKKLDDVFTTPPEFKVGTYGKVIHEMTEMVLGDMGQYAHGNQPVQHVPYLYNYAGQPWKTQKRVRTIMDKLYKATPDGYCGDEDNGQMSAWYVFSAMGFYPVCPGANDYALGSPLFNKITLNLENGKKFVIEAPDNNASNVFVESVELNGNNHEKNWISHSDIANGGRLYFDMDNKPNRKRGVEPEDAPYSVSTSDGNR